MKQLENFAGTMNFVIFPMYFMSTALYPLKLEEPGAGLGVPDRALQSLPPPTPSSGCATRCTARIRAGRRGRAGHAGVATAAWGYDPQRGFGALDETRWRRRSARRRRRLTCPVSGNRCANATAQARPCPPTTRRPGAAGAAGAADLSALAQRLFWGWALLAGVAFFLIWWMQRHGWWVRLIEGDPSGISPLIVLLGGVVTGWCGRRASRLQVEAQPGLAQGWRARYLDEGLRRGQPEATALLSERTHGPHETARGSRPRRSSSACSARWWASSWMSRSASRRAELAEVQKLLQQMTGGMAIALYTTLAGLVVNLWLGLQLLLLDRLADRLAADILADAAAVGR